jgi:hypothetical protein
LQVIAVALDGAEVATMTAYCASSALPHVPVKARLTE